MPQTSVDRHLDVVGEMDFEERVNYIWGRYRTSIIIGVALSIVFVVSVQAVKYLAARRESSIQEVFHEATTNAGLIAFAVDHPNHPLAGFSYLQVANTEYIDKNYKQAAYHYEAAFETLEGTPLAERALLGFAMTQLMSGNGESGKSVLEEIATDHSNLYQTRAEASYNLAIFFWEAKDYPAVSSQLDRIFNLVNEMASRDSDLDLETSVQLLRNNIWLGKAQNLRASIPELH